MMISCIKRLAWASDDALVHQAAILGGVLKAI
jgi:hypothetical protein